MNTETWYIHSLNVSIGSYLGQFLGLEAIHQVFMWAVYGHTCWVLRRFNGAGMETGASHSPRSRFPGQLVVITQNYIPYFCFSSSTRLMYSFMAFSLLLPYRQIKNVLWREKKTDLMNKLVLLLLSETLFHSLLTWGLKALLDKLNTTTTHAVLKGGCMQPSTICNNPIYYKGWGTHQPNFFLIKWAALLTLRKSSFMFKVTSTYSAFMQ